MPEEEISEATSSPAGILSTKVHLILLCVVSAWSAHMIVGGFVWLPNLSQLHADPTLIVSQILVAATGVWLIYRAHTRRGLTKGQMGLLPICFIAILAYPFGTITATYGFYVVTRPGAARWLALPGEPIP